MWMFSRAQIEFGSARSMHHEPGGFDAVQVDFEVYSVLSGRSLIGQEEYDPHSFKQVCSSNDYDDMQYNARIYWLYKHFKVILAVLTNL